MDIKAIQEYLREQNLDGWLLADFHGRNSIAMSYVRPQGMITRRSFYLIPAEGEPIAWVNPVEADKFAHLPGRKIVYHGWRHLETELAEVLKPLRRVAMEYSSFERLPYVGLVEAGTIELIRSFGLEVVSSADLVAAFQARLSDIQIGLHRKAANEIIKIKDRAHHLISEHLTSGKTLTEYDVVHFIEEQFAAHGMTADHAPNCSVDANAGNPHYEPTRENSKTIEKGQLVLIDLWAKHDQPDGVYADITWMAFAGREEDIPENYKKIFAVVTAARDRAIEFLKDNIAVRAVRGAEADDACRAIIEAAGYGDLFTHRTGHSIDSETHGSGPNIDNLETEDARVLQPGHLFSIEPGIYSKRFGFRSEINCLITPGGPEITTLPLQYDIVPLL
ncbi:MAG TPA: Xaa-Pro peptidase family protein [candidate division Zixibacteria bacterium]|nr:Xaa-Pro peptidase family protein [candidate division Zixibacteria bacterium]